MIDKLFHGRQFYQKFGDILDHKGKIYVMKIIMNLKIVSAEILVKSLSKWQLKMRNIDCLCKLPIKKWEIFLNHDHHSKHTYKWIIIYNTIESTSKVWYLSDLIQWNCPYSSIPCCQLRYNAIALPKFILLFPK